MASYYSNKALEDELNDIHRGLKLAMDELIRNKDYGRCEEILKQVDQRMSSTINANKVVRPT